MKLDNVQLSDFRNIASASLHPSHSLTLITGKNGSGKSSLIESLFYLGFGRSFRTVKHTSVIRNNSDKFSVFAKCITDMGEELNVGLQRSRSEQFLCSINGEHSNRLTDLVSRIPLQLFTPQSTDLIIGSPGERRRFIDWGLFHVEHNFNKVFQTYHRLLKNRNALLKQGALLTAKENAYWEQQLAAVGEELNVRRKSYVDELQSVFNHISSEFLPEFCLEISYYKGWEKELSLAESLVKKSAYDIKVGFTSSGPHKSDLRFKVDGTIAQELLSRGQLRMAVAALQLAQTKLFQQQTSRKSIFLLDDVGAELDIEKRERFIDGLLAMDTQLFVTAIEREQLAFIDKYKDKKMFHVEHGRVNEE
ncbi:DNA replication/repair protein RecF [Aestuariibacter sp. A3R04]|uniref:DNA replication/repair protein RecF n=1 Tax=Aestuariibacter sp. A3R04 TaxID=2841571 RepID=UPI001C08B47C|nr:DNA replication/repair protein RecF [Aestuariibacter sp. A3R04]MBU3020208.1 DNA replication/repair protein RecF [Aestuariibacter sp. A3R04]